MQEPMAVDERHKYLRALAWRTCAGLAVWLESWAQSQSRVRNSAQSGK